MKKCSGENVKKMHGVVDGQSGKYDDSRRDTG
jgi:hypothetical protein